ncbi:porin [Paraburkholderia sp. CNPSo 3157]|uniref:Porin n=1 Tax=Paraburkholderia franconis TaxID=2654983 RepID=A0A7X1N772_9BURK|nr:porin [Paraburkholderia franconis]
MRGIVLHHRAQTANAILMVGHVSIYKKCAVEYVKQGFTAIKFDPASPYTAYCGHQLSLDLMESSETFCRRLREAVGNQCDLIFGTHGQMTPSAAIRLARHIEPYDPLWFKEPVPPGQSEAMARVAQKTRIPVAAGERLTTKYEFFDLLRNNSASILQMNLGRVGGILEAKKIASMAEVYYAQIAPHLYNGPIGAARQYPAGRGVAEFPHSGKHHATFLGQPAISVDPASGTITDLYANTPFPVDGQATFGIGSSYRIGTVTLMGNFSYTTIKGVGETSHMKVAEGGANWQVTPAFSAIAGYQYTNFERHHWNQGSLGLHYLLSKRTDVYISGDYLKASEGVNAVIGYSFTPSTRSCLREGLKSRAYSSPQPDICSEKKGQKEKPTKRWAESISRGDMEETVASINP